MSRDDVLRMALEAGFAYRPEDEHLVALEVHGDGEAVVSAGLERFAALVADAARGDYHEGWEEGFKAGVIAEREACAKVCMETAPSLDGQLCAEAIRARGES